MSCIYSTPPPLPCVLILIGGIVAKLVAGRNEARVNRADVPVLEKSIKEGSKNIRVDPGVETLREMRQLPPSLEATVQSGARVIWCPGCYTSPT